MLCNLDTMSDYLADNHASDVIILSLHFSYKESFNGGKACFIQVLCPNYHYTIHIRCPNYDTDVVS